jgi:hypothetical protein
MDFGVLGNEFITQINAQRRLLVEAGELLGTWNDNPEAVRLAGMIRAQLNDHEDLYEAIVKETGIE